LRWRTQDPFADWKIVIIIIENNSQNSKNQDKTGNKKEEESTSSIYNVRKCFLADGPRRSKYFVRLFENDGNFSEAQDKTSRIELNELQAKAFPQLLDYMYLTGEKMSFTTDTASALYSIVKYFGVVRLQYEVKNFCLQDMQHVETCGTYSEHATILQETSLLESAAEFCRENISQIDPTHSRLLHVPDPAILV
jgi:BTB/POZ domain